MSADTIRMANQIARAFALDPKKTEEVAGHIKSFWTRGMIAELLSEAAKKPATVDPVVLEAIKLLPSPAA